MKEGTKKFFALVQKLGDLHLRKSKGYGTASDVFSNLRMGVDDPVSTLDGIFVRMRDKFHRFRNLHKDASNDQVSEPIEDTLLDLAAYCLLYICLYQEEHEREETSESTM